METCLTEENTGTDRLVWLKLNALEFSPKRLRALLDVFPGSPEALLAAPTSEWKELAPELTAKQLERVQKVRDRSFDKELDLLAEIGGSVVSWDDPAYPANLKQLPDAPPVLITRGRLVQEDKFSIAIVGSRRASSYGLSLARRFAHDLAAHGLTIVSGGARGVDTQAHIGAMEGGGRTIAFLGCGCDVNYPSENRKLFDQIAGPSLLSGLSSAEGGGEAKSHGAIISEFPLGTRPEPWRFPARNRLISGTSLGVLVIESPINSGSLITAREAADQGRDVFAVPGPIDTGRNAGCHQLIKDGAKLVETVDDILEELGVLALRSPDANAASTATPPPSPANLPLDQRKILEMLTLQARNVDSMIVESGLPAPQVSGILTLLEMRGLAKRVPGNAFVRVL